MDSDSTLTLAEVDKILMSLEKYADEPIIQKVLKEAFSDG